jgi:RNA polymerase sigma factor (sigma-70 family)
VLPPPPHRSRYLPPGQPSDAQLIAQVRAGATAAYETLYSRHVIAACALARHLSAPGAEADDLVSEAFARVLGILRRGQGPDAAFRPYLLSTLRRVACDRTRRERVLGLSADVGERADERSGRTEPHDAALASLERSLAVRALSRLPERWRAVLWHTEIDDASPADIAPLFGLTPNGVAALAYRAREGLRQAYLQECLAEPADERCRPAAGRLGAWVRGGLGKRDTAQVEAHLSECSRCRVLAAELTEVNASLTGMAESRAGPLRCFPPNVHPATVHRRSAGS